MKLFLDSEQCPNFVKADVEKSKRHMSDAIQDQDDDSHVSHECGEGPEWMDLLQPNPNYEKVDTDFSFDNGGLNMTGVNQFTITLMI